MRIFLFVWALLFPASPSQAADTPVTLTLSNLEQVYTGAARLPTVSSNPSVSVGLSFYARTSQLVYSTMPSVLDSTYLGYSFKNNNIEWMGDRILLGNTGRILESAEIVLVSEAKGADWPTLYAANSNGFLHTVTIAVYKTTGGAPLISSSKQVLIPWCPAAASGQAFKVKVDFPANQVLDDELYLLAGFNTSNTSGVAAGPYDKLKMAVSYAAATVGTNVDVNRMYLVVGGTHYNSYPTTPTTPPAAMVPMITVQAAQQSASNTTAINAGSYTVKAVVTQNKYTGEATSYFNITKAPATVTLSNLTQVANGSQKTATVVTSPVGKSVSVTYNGSATAPSAAGRYPLIATITDPNYTGSNTGIFLLNQQFSNWINQYVTGGSVAAEDAADTVDADSDGLINQLEYAFDYLPGSASSGAMPKLEYANGVMSIVYRKNLLATDLTYQVQASTLLSSGWSDITTTDSVVETIGETQVIRATVTGTSDTKRFIRLKVTKN